MWAYFLSEKLKHKRSFVKKLVWIAPLSILFFAAVLYFPMGGEYFQISAYNWWYTLLLPGILSIITSLIINKDAKSKYRAILAMPFDLKNLWYAKVIVGLWYFALITLIFSIGIIILSSFIPEYDNLLLYEHALGNLLIFISLAWQIPLCMFLTDKFGMFISIVVNFFANLGLGVILATYDFWFIIPYTIPSRLMIPVLKILPNGIPVKDDTALISYDDIILGVVISLLCFLIITIITAKFFESKEEK